MRVVASSLLVAALLNCADAPFFVPALTAPVTGHVIVQPDHLSPGDTAFITVSVTNPSPEAVTIQFGSTCQLGYEAETLDGEVVAPLGPVCGQAITYLTLAPRETKTAEFRWLGDNSVAGGALLPPGTYRVYGVLEAWPPHRITAPALVEIVPSNR
jgi:hypothetical protein